MMGLEGHGLVCENALSARHCCRQTAREGSSVCCADLKKLNGGNRDEDPERS